MKISLVVSDVDGTLVTSRKVLTEGSRAAARLLQDAGIALAITSSRPPRGMKALIDALGITAPTAAFNGGQFVRPDLSVIEEHLVSEDAAAEVCAQCDSHGLDVWLYTGPDWFVRDPRAPHVEHDAMTVGFEPTVVPDFSGRLGSVAKLVGVSDDYDRVGRCEGAVREACGDRVEASRSHPYYLDVTHPAATKGNVIDRLSAMLGIPRSEIAAIGDGPNDVSMFRRSGFAIAMGNAGPEVKAEAAEVTASNDEEGWAGAVRRLISSTRPEANGPPL